MVRYLNASLLCGILALSAFAGDDEEDNSLIYPGYDLTAAKTVEVITASGEVVKGENMAANKFGTSYKNMKVKDEAGTLHKFKLPDDVKEITAKSFSLFKGGFRKPDRDIRYVTVDVIGKSGKKTMVQQLNYEGTDKVLVYNHPGESDWNTIPMTNISYLDVEGFYISLNGGELFEMTDKEYQKKGGFEKAFGSCEAVMQKYPSKKERDFDDFDKHLKTYLDECK
ncbi:MAG: hypothetical protein JW863_23015 [Chitinispirillaceae bacterium]|nr:hypothetical protein [Chitinispirillaceae bacterium]